MTKYYSIFNISVLVLLLLSISGCWNYAEVDDLAIVAGVAIDKNNEDNKLQLTAELVDTQSGMNNSSSGFKMISLSGDTMFEIVRNMISMTGKKLFWSHAKVIIFSEEIARGGLVKVVDWYSRDTETRSDVYIFVSGQETAREILNLNRTTQAIMSFELAQMMKDEIFTSTAPVMEIWDFVDRLESDGASAIAPLIIINDLNGQKNKRVDGTAVFKGDRMVGKLNGDETKSMNFIMNKIQGGVLTVHDAMGKPTYSLEILSSRTKIKPKFVDGKVKIQIHTVTHTGLDEVMSTHPLDGEENIMAIQQRASNELEASVKAVIRKVQKKYDADIFGFGELVHENSPRNWVKLKDKWPNTFADLEVDIDCKVIIQSTAKTKRSIKMR
ncbi:Spore germination protein B3 precursor [compost metagenome]